MNSNDESGNRPTLTKKKTEYEQYDYSFDLRINQDIICQRYFNINKFNAASLKSRNFKEQFDAICALIQEDLNSKTRIYTYNICCSFRNEEDLKKKQAAGKNKSEIYSELHDEFNPDKEKTEEEKNDLTFSFLYKDKVVMLKCWDANIYPQYIRKNIALNNPQYIQVTPNNRVYFNSCDEDTLKYEHQIKKRIFQGREDLIPVIITMFRDVCSLENKDLHFYF